MRTSRIVVDLSVADNANDMAVADFLFELLVDSQEVADYEPIFSVDGTNPERR